MCQGPQVFKEASRHPAQNVEDADAVDGDEGGEVGGDVDLLQGASRRIEGLQGLAGLHVPPLRHRQRNKHQEKKGGVADVTWKSHKQIAWRKTSGRLIREKLFREI